MLFLSVWSPLPLHSADVSVTRARISSGLTLRMSRYAWGNFECHVENSGDRAHEVVVRSVAQDGAPQLNVFSRAMKIPPRTVVDYKMPLLIENSEKFNAEVFVDGNRLPFSQESEYNIRLLSPRESQVAILNDGDESMGAFVQLPGFKGKLYSTVFSSHTLPVDRNLLEHYRALIVYKPDFSRFHSDVYAAILEYVANGGRLLFADPDTILKAAGTPLNALLSVEPLRVRETEEIPALKELFPDFQGFPPGVRVRFLDSVPKGRGVTLLTQDAAPLIRESAFGLGTVKMIAFAPSETHFSADRATWENLLTYLFAGQDFDSERNSFVEPLDKLTGFSVPRILVVRRLLFLYLLLIGVILLAGALFKRAGLSWLAAGLCAVLMTGHILRKAGETVGARESLLADIQIRNLSPVPLTESYVSYFASGAREVDIAAEGERGSFMLIPPEGPGYLAALFGASYGGSPASYGGGGENGAASYTPYGSELGTAGGEGGFSHGPSIQTASPAEFRTGDSGKPSIHGLNIPSRTSRQFMFFSAPSFVSGEGAFSEGESPELLLTEEGWSLKPWKAPGDWVCESAFAVFPGGTVPLEKDSSGSYVLASGEPVFNDTLLKSVREAMAAGFSREIPYLAFLTQLGDSDSGLKADGEPLLQGKRILVVPAKVTAEQNRVRIPGKGILLFPADTISGRVIKANRIVPDPDMPCQLGFSYEIGFALPSWLMTGFRPERITVKLKYSHGGGVRLVPSLRLSGKETPGEEAQQEKNDPRYLDGRDAGGNTFVFEGEDLLRVFGPLDGRAQLRIDSLPLSILGTSEEQLYRASSWFLQDMELTLEGSLPESLVPLKL